MVAASQAYFRFGLETYLADTSILFSLDHFLLDRSLRPLLIGSKDVEG